VRSMTWADTKVSRPAPAPEQTASELQAQLRTFIEAHVWELEQDQEGHPLTVEETTVHTLTLRLFTREILKATTMLRAWQSKGNATVEQELVGDLASDPKNELRVGATVLVEGLSKKDKPPRRTDLSSCAWVERHEGTLAVVYSIGKSDVDKSAFAYGARFSDGSEVSVPRHRLKLLADDEGRVARPGRQQLRMERQCRWKVVFLVELHLWRQECCKMESYLRRLKPFGEMVDKMGQQASGWERLRGDFNIEGRRSTLKSVTAVTMHMTGRTNSGRMQVSRSQSSHTSRAELMEPTTYV
jgi:hypothetical protein